MTTGQLYGLGLGPGDPELVTLKALRLLRAAPPPAAIYEAAAAQLAVVMDGGNDIAYLCQGDPLFYGSFAGILTRLAARYTVTIVPGVSSLTACAAAAAEPLVQRDETLSVIPATLPEDELAARLAQAEYAAIIKLGRHFAKLRRVLARLGMLDGALYVERASLPNQLVAPLVTIDPASVPYFATALVRCRRDGA